MGRFVLDYDFLQHWKKVAKELTGIYLIDPWEILGK